MNRKNDRDERSGARAIAQPGAASRAPPASTDSENNQRFEDHSSFDDFFYLPKEPQ
jgi:hypothetical protein